jgi:hypothetical protein
MDVWEYIRQERLEVPNIYFSHRRDCFRRGGQWLPVPPPHTDVSRPDPYLGGRPKPNEPVQSLVVRVRTIADMISTGMIESPAESVDDIIGEVAAARCPTDRLDVERGRVHARVRQQPLNHGQVAIGGCRADRVVVVRGRVHTRVSQQQINHGEVAAPRCPAGRLIVVCSRVHARVRQQPLNHRQVAAAGCPADRLVVARGRVHVRVRQQTLNHGQVAAARSWPLGMAGRGGPRGSGMTRGRYGLSPNKSPWSSGQRDRTAAQKSEVQLPIR